ncbi:MAG: YaaA family protein [Trichloromonadaceae bacterium]
MKIFLSPSKTQSNNKVQTKLTEPRFKQEALELRSWLQALDKETMGSMMKLTGDFLDSTFDQIHKKRPHSLAMMDVYQGVAFDALDLNSLGDEDLEFAQNHLRVLSAYWGMLRPLDKIHNYRLDFTMHHKDIHLMKVWKDKIVKELEHEDWILDLSSKEFAQLVKGLKDKIHRVEFYEDVDGELKIISSFAKQARGTLARWCIQNQIKHPNDIQTFTGMNYRYRLDLSSKDLSLFSRI